MIGLDTNILVRFFAMDDPVQTPRAEALLRSLSGAMRGYITTVVLVELVWVMRSLYGASHDDIAHIVGQLTSSEDLVVESQIIVKSALRLSATTSSDFTDCLIMRTCQGAWCDHTVTFDRKASVATGMRLVG